MAAWQKSGKTAREVADRIGVNPNTLSRWKWQLGREAAEQEPEQQPSPPEQEHSSPVTVVEVLPLRDVSCPS